MPVNPVFGSRWEEISHFAGVRLRVTGSGNLDLTFLSLDNINTQNLAPLVMSPATNREPTRLANFIDQRAMLKLGVDQIDENFKINRVILFGKPLWSSYPG